MKNPDSLSTHFASEHPDNKIFECPTCSKEFDDLKETLDHGYAHVANNFECQICIEKLPTKLALIQHYSEVHPGVDLRVCVVCNKRYSNTAALAKHRHVHTGERPFYCPYCYATFSLKCSQQVHVRRHINYRPFPCSYCPKRFFSSGDMTKHMRVHTQERPYKCDQCGQQFVMREALVNHWKVHQDKKSLRCPKCPKTFKLRTQLFNHMPVHIGVKPFKCPLCQEACYHLGGIQVHLNSVHVTDGMTQCEICGQTQKLRYKLVQHLMTHRSDFFQSKADWRNHLKKVKPVMKVKGKGQEKVKTTEQDIYGIIRKRRKVNKVNGAVIPITPEEEGVYQEASAFENKEYDDAYIELKPVKKQRRRTRKNKIIVDTVTTQEETHVGEFNDYTEDHDQFMTDPLAINEEVAESKPNVQQKKKRQRKKPVPNSNRVQTQPKQKAIRKRKPATKVKQVRSKVKRSPPRQKKQAIKEECLDESESEEDIRNGIKEDIEVKSEYSDEEWMQEERCYEPPAGDQDRTCGTCKQTFETADLLRNHVVVHI